MLARGPDRRRARGSRRPSRSTRSTEASSTNRPGAPRTCSSYGVRYQGRSGERASRPTSAERGETRVSSRSPRRRRPSPTSNAELRLPDDHDAAVAVPVRDRRRRGRSAGRASRPGIGGTHGSVTPDGEDGGAAAVLAVARCRRRAPSSTRVGRLPAAPVAHVDRRTLGERAQRRPPSPRGRGGAGPRPSAPDTRARSSGSSASEAVLVVQPRSARLLARRVGRRGASS